MGNNDLENGEKIFVKVEQQNLICIDPNSVDVGGNIQPRNVDHENLVMYVNLETDLVPRSTLTSQGDTTVLTSIAKGNFNMMSTTNGDLSTDWTESYLDKEINVNGENIEGSNYDESGQSFGIESLSIVTKGINSIPYVNINFIDVRGKTLFESPENSPYKAFFHLPWPIFYLTVKGYYGKAIRYRLHLVKFSSKYNETNGNFDISTTFVGSTYAFMADIPLKGMMNAPYMYLKTSEEPAQLNQNTGLSEKKASKSSKGYAVLKSVYTEMKQKNLIDENFPVKTLREIDVISKRINAILEKIILDDVVDPRVLNSLKEYGDNLDNFIATVESWGREYLDMNDPIIENDISYFSQKQDKNTLNSILGPDKTGKLEYIIKNYTNILNGSVETFNQIKKERRNTLTASLTTPKIGDISKYYKIFGVEYRVGINELFSELQIHRRSFIEQDEKILKEIELKLNDAVKDPKNGFGFEPTLRNIFAVILANAETYIRLLNEVHIDAFNVGEERKKYVVLQSDELSSTKGESIYPWPEIVHMVDNKKTLAYPGDPLLQQTLKSNDSLLWPEVHFVEEYLNVSTKVSDPLVEKEGGVNDLNIIFETDSDLANIGDINELFRIGDIIPYSNRNVVSFLYEFVERAKILTLYDSFNNTVLNELVETEFKTISEILKDENDIIIVLKDKIKTKEDLKTHLQLYSNVRYPYYVDSLPTTDYITRLSEKPFSVTQYVDELNYKTVDDTKYESLKKHLNDEYLPEEYRLSIYPFNSKKYLDYINKPKFDENELKLYGGILQVTQKTGFITSPFNRYEWLKDYYMDVTEDQNLFTQKLNYTDKHSTNILNTPYFHKQLYSDYNKDITFGKYASSAYLLLNSLPYVDLDDQIRMATSFEGGGDSGIRLTPPVRVSSLFREIGSTHYLPYHLIAKWGSIYHRYKKHKLDGVDILNGFTLNDDVTTTTPIDYELFYNSGKTETSFTGYTVGVNEIVYSNNEDLGSHPYYDSVFHKIVNGEHTHDINTGNESFSVNTQNNTIRYKKRRVNNLNYWSGFVDNTKLKETDFFYTLLPSDGDNTFINNDYVNGNVETGVDTFENSQEKYFRVIWDNEIVGSFENTEFFKPNEYNRSFDIVDRTLDKIYSLTENNTKIYDLLGTFSPLILEEFEELFLDFATDYLNLEISNSRYPRIKYNNFQKLLKEIVTVNKEGTDTSDNELIVTTLKRRQKIKLKFLTEQLCEYDNFLKITIANPKEMNPYVLEGFNGGNSQNTFKYQPYNTSQLVNQKFLDLYVGENPNSENNYYLEFFQVNNVQLSDDNIIAFRPLILMYAGYREIGKVASKTEFQKYVRENIFDRKTDGIKVGGANNRFDYYLQQIVAKFQSLTYEKSNQMINFNGGYNSNNIKLELYDYFKSFNDKWSAGNSINQRLLLEEFLFLDKANKDIGDSIYLNIDRFISIFDEKNENANLYSVISMLIQGTGLDMRPLPAYVNFYGNNLKNRTRVLSSKSVASSLFGTFLEVDYIDSSPKVIIQYTGKESKRLADLDSNRINKFSDDSYNIFDTVNNPIIVSRNIFETEDLVKSNKVVAFEVNVGDQHNSMFKSIQLDQSTLKNTTESFIAIENMGRSNTGSGTANVDVGLFNIYRDRSYTCEITSMGNVMIQPTMYFYLKNIPMFRGTYWIIEVTHKIQNNSIVTTFKGVRISNSSLPDPTDSFVATYRPLIDKIINNIRQQLKNPLVTESTAKVITQNNRTYISNTGKDIHGQEEITTTPKVGVDLYGIPFNGFNGEETIQKIKYQGVDWYKAKVVEMGNLLFYPISDTTDMSLAHYLKLPILPPSTIKWGELKNRSNDNRFYSTKMLISNGVPVDKILNGKTEFLNHINGIRFSIEHGYNFDRTNFPLSVQGPINNGPNVPGSGIALSAKLMKDLGISNGEVLLFRVFPKT